MPCLLVFACVVTAQVHGREWTDSTGKFSVEGELVWHDEKSVVLEKPDGSRVHIELTQLSKKDVAFLITLKNEKGDKQQPAARRQPEKKRAVERLRAGQNQEFTAFGELKLRQEEIDLFIQQCQKEKPGNVKTLQRTLNSRAEHAPPAEVLDLRKLHEFVIQNHVLIAPRDRSPEEGEIFKPCVNHIMAYAEAELVSVLDNRSALVRFSGNPPVSCLSRKWTSP
jgi:hypothetical protein